MILRHPVTIAGKPSQYTARLRDARVYITVPRVVFHGGMMHLVTRQTEIRAIGTVFKLWEHMADKQPLDAWRLIGENINDVYLMGVK